MKQLTLAITLAACALAWSAPARADLFVPQGTQGTLSVEYAFESSGTNTQGVYDVQTWKATRRANLTEHLVAQGMAPLPALHPLTPAEEAAMKSDLGTRQARAERASRKMQPMQDQAMAIVEKCGDDEACVEREVMKMSQTVDLDKANSARDDMEQAAKMEPRFQLWTASNQSGTFVIDESMQARVREVGEGATAVYTREEIRSGAGKLAHKAGTGRIEVDNRNGDFALVLPIPVTGMPCTHTIKTTEPDEKSGSTSGVCQIPKAYGAPIIVKLKGGLVSQAGKDVIKIKGDTTEGGTLTVSWKFTRL